MMTLIDGKAVSAQIKKEIAAEVADMVARGEKRPHLAAILVGHDGGSVGAAFMFSGKVAM